MVAFYTLSNVLIKSMASPLSFFIVNGYPAIKSAKKKGFFLRSISFQHGMMCAEKNSLFIKKNTFTQKTHWIL